MNQETANYIMWEFNQGAIAFYESVGFETYRRYMEIML